METPKSECLTFAIVGRVNVGKSTLLNFIAGHPTAIVSPVPGTTTDVVEKAMELRPFGRVVFLDTAGIDDTTPLWQARRLATQRAVERADIIIAVTKDEADALLENYVKEFAKPVINVHTHVAAREDARPPCINVDALDASGRDAFLGAFKIAVEKILPTLSHSDNVLDGLVTPNNWILHVVPLDSQAPKNRLILPQVMTLRSALDAGCRSVVANENNFTDALADTKSSPQLVICDSQVVEKVMAVLPDEIPCTTYSILMARMKGGFEELAAGAAAISRLNDGDRILIAEVCTHHAGDDDIGRVKIPKLLQRFTGKKLEFDFTGAQVFLPAEKKYALIVHCGGCMATRGQIAARISQARDHHVPITNYGMCISHCQGVLQRALSAFAAKEKDEAAQCGEEPRRGFGDGLE